MGGQADGVLGFILGTARVEDWVAVIEPSAGLRYRSVFGGGAGSSGNGINSSWSRSGSFMRPASQSAFAASIRSIEDETKFQYRNRSPKGSPPSSMTIDGTSAVSLSGPGPPMTTISP